MAYYLIQASYTREAWATLVRNPEDRSAAVRAVTERLGGSLVGSWLCFGDYDVVAVVNMPDNTSAAGLAIAAAAGGAVKSFKTTPLLTGEEGVESMRKAAASGYRPPGG